MTPEELQKMRSIAGSPPKKAPAQTWDLPKEIANWRNLRSENKPKEEKGFLSGVMERFKTGGQFGTNVPTGEEATKKGVGTIKNILETPKRAIEGFKEGVELAEESRAGIAKAQREGDIGMGRAAVEQAGAGLQSLFLPASRAVGAALSPATEAITERGAELVPESVKTGAMDLVKKAKEEFDTLDPQTQRSLTNLGRTIESLMTVGSAGVAAPAATVAKEGVRTGARILEKGIKEGEKMVEKGVRSTKQVVGGVLKKKAEKEALVRSEKIQELVAPGINSKEMKKIIDEGRATRAQEGFKERLFGKQPDIVERSEAVKRISDTIDRNIPDADKLDDLSLMKEIDKKVSEKSVALKPDMQNVMVKESQKKRVSDAWNTLKKEQMADPELSTVPGYKLMQKNFESFVDDVRRATKNKKGQFRSKTLDDVWALRKAYDNSIKDNIKNATHLSDPALQYKKEIWLQNRQILNDIIHDMDSGLGDVSRKSFREMADMYEGRGNILGKSKIDIKGKEGLFTVKNALKALGLGAAYQTYSSLTGE